MEFFSKVNRAIFPGASEYPKSSAGKLLTLGLQHAFAMSCATILVPLLTGLDVGVALFTAGVGTLIFHICTRGRMPTFLGSSFAFIVALQSIIGNSEFGADKTQQIAAAMGGIVCAGLVYVLIALLVKLVGNKFIDILFPPLVRGVGIAIIGLNLAGAAINNIQNNNGFALYSPGYFWSWLIALMVCVTAICLSSYGKGMVKMSSIVIALAVGYVVTAVCVSLGIAPAGMMNTAAFSAHGWIEIPNFVLPRFEWKAILMVAPIAIVTCVEHVGDVYANGAVVGKNFIENPGLARTLMGDGLATAFAGMVGGPSNTTYSENTAVLAATGNYNPTSLRVAALIAIVISFFGKGIGAIETVPNAVLGGACIVLYGMIASVGLRTLVENHVDFTVNRNLSIAAVMLVLSMGGAVIGFEHFNFSGIGLGVIAGIILNLVLPKQKKGPSLIAHSVKNEEIVQEKK